MAFAQQLAANTLQANTHMKQTATIALQEFTNDCMGEFMSRCSAESNAGKECCVWNTGNRSIEHLIGPNITPEGLCRSAQKIFERKMQEQFNMFDVRFEFGEIRSKKNPALHWACSFELRADWSRDKMQREATQKRDKQEADRVRLALGHPGQCNPIEYPEFRMLGSKFGMEPAAFLARMEKWITSRQGTAFAKHALPQSPPQNIKSKGPEELIYMHVGDNATPERPYVFIHLVIDAEHKSKKEELPEELQRIIQWTLGWVKHKNSSQRSGDTQRPRRKQ
jgi:hypothetical protein